jgi:hypothetical protein
VVRLFNRYVNEIILEKQIFEYYRHKLELKLDTLTPEQNRIVQPCPANIVCHHPIMTNRVDNAITSPKQSYRGLKILELA